MVGSQKVIPREISGGKCFSAKLNIIGLSHMEMSALDKHSGILSIESNFFLAFPLNKQLL